MNKAFTLIEVSIVVAIIAVLLSITTISLTTIQNHTYVDSAVETLVSDIKHQQLKTMSGSTEGGSDPEFYGVYFESDRYTLFKGATYNLNDPLNFTVTLNPSLEFTNNILPDSLLLFHKGSGEIQNFSGTTNTITIRNNATDESQTIIFNRYGVITSIY